MFVVKLIQVERVIIVTCFFDFTPRVMCKKNRFREVFNDKQSYSNDLVK